MIPAGQKASEALPDPETTARQRARVLRLMSDGRRRTLGEISRVTRDPEASVSARLRDLRKPEFGGREVNKERLTNGLFEYWISNSDT